MNALGKHNNVVVEKQKTYIHLLTSPFFLVRNPIFGWDAFHAVYLQFYVVPSGDGVGNFRHYLLVHLGTVDGESGSRIQLLVADMTFEVLGFLMKSEYFLVVKIAITIPYCKSVKDIFQ